MTVEQIIELFKHFESLSVKNMTAEFNSLSIDERKQYLDYLQDLPDAKIYKGFIEDIREQAVVDFWENERQLILNGGKGSRNWTPKQIESILNIDSDTGIMNPNLAGS